MYQHPISKLKSPSTGLIVLAIINLVSSVVLILSWFSGIVINPERVSFKSGAEQFGYYIGAIIPFAVSLTSIVASPIIIYGAVRMRNARSYTISKTAAVLALLPVTSLCCLLGIPFGIWSISTLNRPEIKSIFRD
jgi:hypothetical protein